MRILALLSLLLAAGSPDPGTVKGTLTLRGPAPARKIFRTDMLGDDVVKAHPDGVAYYPVVTDRDSRVASALVYVKTGLEGKTFPASTEPKRMRVENYTLLPRMMGIMPDQELVIGNFDDTLHAVHVLPQVQGNKQSNSGLPKKGMSFKVTFAQPEIGILVKTEDHHEWEQAHISVLPHPYYAVTDSRGAFEIPGLPPGKYTLEAWQENCEPVTQAIEVKANETRIADFTLVPRR